jgi:hypothetical protein
MQDIRRKNLQKVGLCGDALPKLSCCRTLNLHGSYNRHVLYFAKQELVYKFIEIKRIKCLSCETTHAVMPGDIIPYKLLSLLVVLFILTMIYIKKAAVLKVAAIWGFSYQFIYSILYAFQKHAQRIYQYFRETSHGIIQPNLDGTGILSLIQKPYTRFQSGYVEFNKRPCFMCKFLGAASAPPIGRMPPALPLQGQQHNP